MMILQPLLNASMRKVMFFPCYWVEHSYRAGLVLACHCLGGKAIGHVYKLLPKVEKEDLSKLLKMESI